MNKTTDTHPPIVIVAGMSKSDRGIGMKNGLLWHVPTDLKRFKALTLGHPIIMGRKTFESIIEIIGKPLPGRTNIVISSNRDYEHPGAKVAHSLAAAIALAETESPQEIHIGGGAQIYAQALPLTARLHITWFYDQQPADSFFPYFEDTFALVTEHPKQEHDGLEFQWMDYQRKEN